MRYFNHNQKCIVDRKGNCNLFDTSFDIFLGKQCAWNILLEQKRQLFQQEGQYLSRKGFLNEEEKKEYEQKERKA